MTVSRKTTVLAAGFLVVAALAFAGGGRERSGGSSGTSASSASSGESSSTGPSSSERRSMERELRGLNSSIADLQRQRAQAELEAANARQAELRARNNKIYEAGGVIQETGNLGLSLATADEAGIGMSGYNLGTSFRDYLDAGQAHQDATADRQAAEREVAILDQQIDSLRAREEELHRALGH